MTPVNGPDWIVLPVPGGRSARRRVLLLHGALGIALVEPGPPRGPQAVRALRRVMERGGVAETHGGLPPVLHLALPSTMDARLHDLLCWEFAEHPPLDMARPEGWTETVRAVLAGRPRRAKAAPEAGKPSAPEPPWPVTVEPPASQPLAQAAAAAPPIGDRPRAIRGPRQRSGFAPLPQRPTRWRRGVLVALAAGLALLVALLLAVAALHGEEVASDHHVVVDAGAVAPDEA